MNERRIEKPVAARTERNDSAEREWHPLIRFVGPEDSFGNEAKLHIKEFGTENVDWFRRGDADASKGQQVGERHIISGINSNRKASSGYFVCTGVVALGFNPELQTNVSFLTHQTASSWGDQKFIEQVRSSLRTFAQQTDQKKRSLLIFTPPIPALINDMLIDRLKRVIHEELGVEPDIAKVDEGGVHALDVKLDTEHGQIFISYS